MSDGRARRVACAALAALSVGVEAPAYAQQQACVRSYESAQEQRLRNDLLTSRETLGECVRLCPSPLRDECGGWQREIEKFLSSVRIKVVDTNGAELAPTTAYVDARPVDPSHEIFVIPGDHAMSVEVRGRTLQQRFTTKAEQHGIIVELALKPEPPAPPEGGKGPTSRDPAVGAEPARSRTPSVVAFSVGGVSLIASLALLTYGHVERTDMKSTCEPKCDPDRVDAVRTMWIVSAGLGGLALVGLTTGWLLWPKAQVSATANGVQARFLF